MRLLWLALVAFAIAPATQATTYYTYDNLGRVTQVVESDGTTTQYTYDANGNVTSINRIAATNVLTVGSISTASGAVGSSITINGSGFSSIASQNDVTIDGVAATVTYASSNRLVVTVPSGASTGSIAVRTPSGSVTAASTFTVTPVSITSFSPAMGGIGSAITINGGGFDPNPANDNVTLNGTALSVTSATATQLHVIAPLTATAGHIEVGTAAGTAISSGYFVVPSGSYTVGQLGAVYPLTPGASGQVFVINNPAQVGVGLFDGSPGQMMTFVLTNVSLGGSYQIYAPDGSVFASGYLANNTAVNLSPLPAAGTYALYLIPGGGASWSATVTLQTDAVGTLSTSGAPLPVALASAQNATLGFTGVAGQSYSLELTQFTSNPGNGRVTATIIDSSGAVQVNCGTYWASTSPPGNCDFTLPVAGTYSVRLLSAGLYAMSFNVLLNQDFAAALAAGTPGPDVNVNLVAGQHALFKFTASAGQTLALYVGSVSIMPSSSDASIVVTTPSGTALPTTRVASGASTTLNLTNLAAGTYSVLVTPNNLNAGPASMQVALANGVTAALPSDGSTAPVQTYVPGQNGYFTFAGTAGQDLGLALTQVTLAPTTATNISVNIFKPDGTSLTTATCYTSSSPGCVVSLLNLPQTGTYSLIAYPQGQATMTLALTLSQDVGGTLTFNNTSTVTLSSPGQSGAMTFTVGSGQPALLTVSSLTTTPAAGAVTFYLYDSHNNLVTYSTLTAAGTVDFGNLAAGTYKVVMTPNSGAAAALQVTLKPGSSGVLPNGSSVSFSTTTPAQSAFLTFSGTSGQSMSLAITALTFTPNSNSAVIATVKRPDNTIIGSFPCYTYNPGCEIRTGVLTQTGTYNVTVTPPGQTTTNFTATLSTDISTTLTAGTALPINLAAMGQGVAATFTITSQQNVALNLGSISTAPANMYMNVAVLNSAGNSVASGGDTVNATFNMNLAPGTYTAYVVPNFPATGTLQLTLQPSASSTLSLTGSGSGATFGNQVPGQFVYLTFQGTAGASYSLAFTGLSTTPSSACANALVFDPNQNIVGSTGCFTGSFEVHLRNLPATGTYTVRFTYQNGQPTVSFTATLSADVTGTLTLNSPTTLNLTAMGQGATMTFTVPSQQNIAVNLGGFNPAGNYYLYVYPASGPPVNYGNTSSTLTFNLMNLAAGTYTAVVYPVAPQTDSAIVEVASAAGGVLTPTTSGTGTSIGPTAPGQNAYLTFTANAGDSYSLALTGFTIDPSWVGTSSVVVRGSSGNFAGSAICSTGGSCEIHMLNLAADTYTATVASSSPGWGVQSFTATLSHDVTGTLVSGTPFPINLQAMGQSATLTMTLASQQSVAVTLGSLSMTPGGSYMTLSIYRSTGGGSIVSNSTSTSVTDTATNLAAGTYFVVATPNSPATGTAQISH